MQMNDRDHDREESIASTLNDAAEVASQAPSVSASGSTESEQTRAQRGIDLLFSREFERVEWTAPGPPEALGELRDSRHMLPLVFPSNPRLLAAVPRTRVEPLPVHETRKGGSKRESTTLTPNGHVSTFLEVQKERPVSRSSMTRRGNMGWKSRAQKLRMIDIETLEWVDGVRGQGKWAGVGHVRGPPEEEDAEEDSEDEVGSGSLIFLSYPDFYLFRRDMLMERSGGRMRRVHI